MPEEHPQQAAKRLVDERGWLVFPVHGVRDGACSCGNPTCGSPGKHPATAHGVKDASRSTSAFQLHHNIGVATGGVSGVFVVDVDGEDGERSLAALGDLPPTLAQWTGNGRHLFFRAPASVKIASRVSKLGRKLDVRGDGGYVVVAPSMHHSGRRYEWANALPVADAPTWLIDLVRKDTTRSAPPEPTEFDDLDGMLSSLDPDLPYDEWIAVGMALHRGGHPLSMWEGWSSGGAKYKPGTCAHHWKSFRPEGEVTMGTLFHMAWSAGWRPPERVAMTGPHPAQAFLDRVLLGHKELDIEPTGLIGDTVSWILRSALKPQPELALLNVLAALGAVFGRRYRTPWSTYSNIYVVGLAPTGQGKDASRKRIARLMIEAGLDKYLGGNDFISAPGIEEALTQQPTHLVQLDEFGDFIAAISDERAPSHKRQIGDLLMKLYSSSDGVHRGGTYANKENAPRTIYAPGLCIYGTSTADRYAEVVKRSAVSSGSLNRFIVSGSRVDFPERNKRPVDLDPPKDLVERWAALDKPKPEATGGNLKGLTPSTGMPDAITVPWGPGVEDRLDELGEEEDDRARENDFGTGALWMRMRENAIKLALISAICRNPWSPEIEMADLAFGEGIVRHALQYTVAFLRDNLAETREERATVVVQKVIREGGADGVARTDICRKTRQLGRKARDEALIELEREQKVIESRKVQTAGRTGLRYFARTT